MSLLGIGKGLIKVVEGVVEADGEKIFKGVAGTALSTAGVVVKHVIHEEVGQALSDHGENVSDD